MDKILLTGHRGFIGRNIAEKIKVLTPNIDVLDYGYLKKYVQDHRVKVIIHCAVTQDFYQNLAMLVNILRLPVKRIITFGSGCQFRPYPKSPDYKRFKELQAEAIKGDKRVTNLILYGVYGKYEPIKETFISNAIVSTLQGSKFKIFKERLMSYVSVDDVVKVVKYFIYHKGKVQTYSIVSEDSLYLTEIAKLISRNYSLGKGLDSAYLGDSVPLREELPDFKFTPIKEGIKSLTEYYAGLFPPTCG